MTSRRRVAFTESKSIQRRRARPVLTFNDGNTNKEKLFYALDFCHVPPGTPAQLDPIIDNQGGGPGGFMDIRGNSTLLIGAAVLLLWWWR